ncbi:MAG: sigma-54 dependent transcriptional regulator [Pseudomonadota bacterium]
MKILIVDDEDISCRSIQRMLRTEGIRSVSIAGSGKEALDTIRNASFDVVILDVMLPDINGDEVLKAAKEINFEAEFVMLSAFADVSTAVRCLKHGAYDYLTKPVDYEALSRSVRRAYEHKLLVKGIAGFTEDSESPLPDAFNKIKTVDKALLKALRFAALLAETDNAVLITGETGTGKELAAVAIHETSSRRSGPFVAVNVAAVADNLFEGAFFGHVKGAFTGADRESMGYVEKAEGGTLFLDEIGDLSPASQAKLLRLLQEKDFFKVGSAMLQRANIRIISATNQDLKALCQSGRFRTDLYYRLRMGQVYLPALDARRGDIPLLAHYFLNELNLKYGKKISFTPEALAAIRTARFPGNVREILQVVERGMLGKNQSDKIFPSDLDLELSQESNCYITGSQQVPMITLRECRARHVLGVLENCGGNRSQSAQVLGISVRQLQKYLIGVKKTDQ